MKISFSKVIVATFLLVALIGTATSSNDETLLRGTVESDATAVDNHDDLSEGTLEEETKKDKMSLPTEPKADLLDELGRKLIKNVEDENDVGETNVDADENHRDLGRYRYYYGGKKGGKKGGRYYYGGRYYRDYGKGKGRGGKKGGKKGGYYYYRDYGKGGGKGGGRYYRDYGKGGGKGKGRSYSRGKGKGRSRGKGNGKGRRDDRHNRYSYDSYDSWSSSWSEDYYYDW